MAQYFSFLINQSPNAFIKKGYHVINNDSMILLLYIPNYMNDLLNLSQVSQVEQMYSRQDR